MVDKVKGVVVRDKKRGFNLEDKINILNKNQLQ